MTCMSCSGAVERQLQQTFGVYDAVVDLMGSCALVAMDPLLQTPQGVCEAIQKLGFRSSPLSFHNRVQRESSSVSRGAPCGAPAPGPASREVWEKPARGCGGAEENSLDRGFEEGKAPPERCFRVLKPEANGETENPRTEGETDAVETKGDNLQAIKPYCHLNATEPWKEGNVGVPQGERLCANARLGGSLSSRGGQAGAESEEGGGESGDERGETLESGVGVEISTAKREVPTVRPYASTPGKTRFKNSEKKQATASLVMKIQECLKNGSVTSSVSFLSSTSSTASSPLSSYRTATCGHTWDRQQAPVSSCRGEKEIVAVLRRREGVIACSRIDDGDSAVLHVCYNPSLLGARQIVALVEAEGFLVTVQRADPLRTQREEMKKLISSLSKNVRFSVGPATLVLFLALATHMAVLPSWLRFELVPGVTLSNLVMLVLTIPVQFCWGYCFQQAAVKACTARCPTMDCLVALSTNLAFFYSCVALGYSFLSRVVFARQRDDFKRQFSSGVEASRDARWAARQNDYFVHAALQAEDDPPTCFDACATLTTVLLIGKWLQQRVKAQALKMLDRVLDKPPASAILVAAEAKDTLSGLEGKNPGTLRKTAREIPVDLLHIGDVIEVPPAETLPADGLLLSPSCARVDEQLLTGEAKCVCKSYGDQLLAGSKNGGSASILLHVNKIGDQTVLSQISALASEVQRSRLPIQAIADKLAAYFVPVVLVIVAITLVAWSAVVFSFSTNPSFLQHTVPRDLVTLPTGARHPQANLGSNQSLVFRPSPEDDLTARDSREDAPTSNRQNAPENPHSRDDPCEGSGARSPSNSGMACSLLRTTSRQTDHESGEPLGVSPLRRQSPDGARNVASDLPTVGILFPEMHARPPGETRKEPAAFHTSFADDPSLTRGEMPIGLLDASLVEKSRDHGTSPPEARTPEGARVRFSKLGFEETIHWKLWIFFVKSLFVLRFVIAVCSIACPCAMGLAVPVALAAAAGRAAAWGILIQNGAAFEAAGKAQTIVFDKTGTLTTGKMKVAAAVLSLRNIEEYLLPFYASQNKAENDMCRETPHCTSEGIPLSLVEKCPPELFSLSPPRLSLPCIQHEHSAPRSSVLASPSSLSPCSLTPSPLAFRGTWCVRAAAQPSLHNERRSGREDGASEKERQLKNGAEFKCLEKRLESIACAVSPLQPRLMLETECAFWWAVTSAEAGADHSVAHAITDFYEALQKEQSERRFSSCVKKAQRPDDGGEAPEKTLPTVPSSRNDGDRRLEKRGVSLVTRQTPPSKESRALRKSLLEAPCAHFPDILPPLSRETHPGKGLTATLRSRSKRSLPATLHLVVGRPGLACLAPASLDAPEGSGNRQQNARSAAPDLRQAFVEGGREAQKGDLRASACRVEDTEKDSDGRTVSGIATTVQSEATDAEKQLLSEWIAHHQAETGTVVVVHTLVEVKPRTGEGVGEAHASYKSVFLGAVAFADELSPDAEAAVAYLKDALRLKLFVCTGDNRRTAQRVATALGISPSCVLAEALPPQKAAFVRSLQTAGNRHKRSHGRSKRRKGETRDEGRDERRDERMTRDTHGRQGKGDRERAVHLHHDFSRTEWVLKRQRPPGETAEKGADANARSWRTNFTWALGFNVLALPLAAGVFYPHVYVHPLAAATAMALSCFLVLLNASGLARFPKYSEKLPLRA
ncbi:putative copper-transporting ATPase 1 [Neospora caninum Liverpool]|uniref:Putative copper-transporting ATPase 1 n=1 Tax=Neospora caninum (strain Liverpool) TaxID=572307 RepID=F0VLW3_NEOCL|nr:putative copper-transporting ATPase 1 [Neospora caninum Liverpool]CBZ54241.1 putative copper-transporting ATPase 1 [Neospora caninum Liverpool]|eukprot:XP_003884272.1 putative copper-transporting ATPase 1 [Neospora caninum Liverpool]